MPRCSTRRTGPDAYPTPRMSPTRASRTISWFAARQRQTSAGSAIKGTARGSARAAPRRREPVPAPQRYRTLSLWSGVLGQMADGWHSSRLGGRRHLAPLQATRSRSESAGRSKTFTRRRRKFLSRQAWAGKYAGPACKGSATPLPGVHGMRWQTNLLCINGNLSSATGGMPNHYNRSSLVARLPTYVFFFSSLYKGLPPPPSLAEEKLDSNLSNLPCHPMAGHPYQFGPHPWQRHCYISQRTWIPCSARSIRTASSVSR